MAAEAGATPPTTATPHPKQRRPVVAVDLDEVLGAFVPALASFYNEAYGATSDTEDAPLTAEAFHSYEFHQVWGGTREEADLKMRAFFKSRHFLGDSDSAQASSISTAISVPTGIPVIAGAMPVLQRYAHAIDFHVVTSRQDFLADETRRWLDLHYPSVFCGVAFGNHYNHASAVKRSKPQMCADIDAALLIDDSLKYASQCAAAGIPVVLFGDYAWNQGAVPSGVNRVSTWAGVAAHLEALLKQRRPANANELGVL